MIKDFYEDVLNAFDDKEDKKVIEAVHKYYPNTFLVNSNELFFAKNADETINGCEFMTHVIRVASRYWKENADAHTIDVVSYLTQIWYDMQYYHYKNFGFYLFMMSLEEKYEDVPEQLIKPYKRYNGTTYEWEIRNDHKKQQKAYKQYAKSHGVHDFNSMQAYLYNRHINFGGLEFGKVKEPEKVSE